MNINVNVLLHWLWALNLLCITLRIWDKNVLFNLEQQHWNELCFLKNKNIQRDVNISRWRRTWGSESLTGHPSPSYSLETKWTTFWRPVLSSFIARHIFPSIRCRHCLSTSCSTGGKLILTVYFWSSLNDSRVAFYYHKMTQGRSTIGNPRDGNNVHSVSINIPWPKDVIRLELLCL